MPNALPPVPYKAPLADTRTMMLAPAWIGFFRELFTRVGGATGQSTTDLQATATSLQTQITSLQSQLYDFGVGRVL